MKKALNVISNIFIIIFLILVAIGTASGIVYMMDREHYALSSNVDYNLYKMREEMATAEMQLRLRIKELEEREALDNGKIVDLQSQITELENQPYKVLYGEFIGINSYGDKTYHVILVNGVEVETIGDESYTFVMNEKVIVLCFGDVLYSIPLREVE